MEQQKIDGSIDQKVDEAQETMELFAGRLDAATQCAQDRDTQAGDEAGEDMPRSSGNAEETVTAAGDPLRGQTGK